MANKKLNIKCHGHYHALMENRPYLPTCRHTEPYVSKGQLNLDVDGFH